MTSIQLACFLFLVFPPYQLLVLGESLCLESEHRCANSDVCIQKAQICDGEAHCPEKDDEFDCQVYLCLAPFFECKNKECISSSFQCDGQRDCKDGTDEENCEPTTLRSPTYNKDCREPNFRCNDGDCISGDWVCDGANDCKDWSDESPAACKTNPRCDNSTDFLCRNHECIVRSWVCDGENDCEDNSDEENCPHKDMPMAECKPELERFRCHDNSSCIAYKQLCDNHTDCTDGSDEGGQCATSCSVTCHHNCQHSPAGPICQCPQGTSGPECLDINECLVFGICDQRCNNTFGSYSCYCDIGYVLEADGKTCKVSDEGEDALLYFSTYDQVRTVSLASGIERTVAKGLKHVAGVACDGRALYWSSIYEGEETIIKSNIDGSGKEYIVSSGVGSPEDIAVDWLTHNIYFTDLKWRHIGVCEQHGEHCVIIVNMDIDKPRGIALLPAERIMFWSDWGHRASISTSGMDGSNPRAFIKDNIYWPNDITIDYPGSRLYWIDAKLKTIESIKLDGSDRKVVLSDSVKHPFSIALFGSNIYWSDWVAMEILACNKFTGKERHTVKKEKDEMIYGVHVYHPAMHVTNSSNPCANSPCSDLCLLAPNTEGYACACPQEKTLSSDLRTCESSGRKPTLVLGHGHTIMLIEHQALGKQTVHQMNLKTIRSISALTFDSDGGNVIISDAASRKINFLELEGGKVVSFIRDSIGHVTSMDFDNLASNLYWTDMEKGTIEVFNMKRLQRTVLLQNMVEVPIALALVPKEGFMFVAFSHNRRVHIDRIRMDGSLLHRTHVTEGLLGPHISLHYDEDLNRVFWADAFTGAIESTDSEGLDRFSFAKVSSPMGLTTVSNDLFYTSYRPNVMWGNKYSFDGDFKNMPTSLDIDDWNEMDFMRVTAAKGFSHMGPNPCADFGGCSDFCLLAGKSRVCSCLPGKVLKSDGVTCEDMPKCANDKPYQCHNGQCIALELVCNGHNDCPGGEDEQAMCKPPSHLSCPELHFPCANGERCIDLALRCNGAFDCIDKSDEVRCNTTESLCTGEFDWKCDSGECITRRFLCDGTPNCHDGSDEAALRCGVHAVCRDSEFKCDSGTCLPSGWKCDRTPDCTDGSDEKNCERVGCGSRAFTCDNDNCIPMALKCDGADDCGDRSDEKECEERGDCPLPNFKCTTLPNLCLPPEAICNSIKECSGGEDEVDCSSVSCDTSSEFKCRSNGQCIPNSWKCDGLADCLHGDDEDPALCKTEASRVNATTQSPATQETFCAEFSCDNGQCLPFTKVCNKMVDCADGSDEGGRCYVECSSIDCAVDGSCHKTPKGPHCRCDEGFRLSGDKTCVDVNECAIESMCSQTCNNYRGSYECSCVQPYFLPNNDHSTCKAVGNPMEILYTVDNQLRKMTSNFHMKVLFDMRGVEIEDIDVDMRKGLVYWTSSSGVTQFDMKTLTRKHYMKGINRFRKVSFDWIHNIVYIAEGDTRILACLLERQLCVKVYSSLDNIVISALTVDPINSYLFWAETSHLNFGSPVGTIKCSDLSGANVTTVVEGGLSLVSSIAVNDIKKILYWSDVGKKRIAQSKLDGSNKKIILDTAASPIHMVLFEDNIYYATNIVGAPFIVSYLYGNQQGESDPLDIRVAHPVTHFTINQVSRQRMGPNKCANSSCSHLCLDSSAGPVCMCPDGTRTAGACGVSEDNLLAPIVTFGSHSQDGVTSSPSGSGISMLLIVCLALSILTLSTAYHLCLRKRVAHLVPKIHFRNSMFNGGYSESNLRSRATNGFVPTSPPAMMLPNIYEPMDHPAPVQIKYANEMSIKMGEEEFWNTRRNSESSTGTDYAEIQDSQKLPLL